MLLVLFKFLPYVFCLALAYGLKRLGLFGPGDYRVAVKLVLNVTLPAAVIVSFSAMTPDRGLLVMTLLGIGCNVLALAAGLLLSRHQTAPQRALWALALPGFNIGAFGLPIISAFLTPAAVASTCFLDIGNAVMCTGGTYAITDSLLRGKDREGSVLAGLVKKLCGSTPFLTYSSMLLLTLLGLRVPGAVGDFLRPIANANPFCAMFMLGLMFDLDLAPDTLRSVGLVVLGRNMLAVLFALAAWFLLPLPLPARQALCLLVFAPPSVLTPAFTEKCGGSAAAASCISSLCILTGFIGMTAVLTLLHIQ